MKVILAFALFLALLSPTVGQAETMEYNLVISYLPVNFTGKDIRRIDLVTVELKAEGATVRWLPGVG